MCLNSTIFSQSFQYDYQICAYATPAIDLIYFLHNFISDEDRLARYDEILSIYHSQFTAALENYGYLKQPPSLLDLQIEMLKNGSFMAVFSLFTYPYLINMDTFTSEDYAEGPAKLKIKAFQNERYKKFLKEALAKYLGKGYITN